MNYITTDKVVTKENTPIFCNTLPESVFIRFNAKKLKNAKIAWLNYSLLNDYGIPTETNSEIEAIEQNILNSYAYMIPSEERNEDEFFIDDNKEFIGDRYGDTGEYCNGGGVRCGISGHFQIKGIGRNQLANRKMDYWHTHGGATIEEGIREAIWAEVLHKELPHKAIRILAVISTGKTTPYDFGLLKKDEDKEPLGGLIIREVNIRPAHFLRAVFFEPRPEYAHELSPDFVRTNAAVNALPNIFAAKLGTEKKEPNASFIKDTISHTYTHLAEQVAVSKVKRIAHGALTSGNTEIFGKYIDFGTTTALSGFGNPIVSRGMAPIWSEIEQLTGYIPDVAFTYNKYLGDDQESTVDGISKYAGDRAYSAYHKQLNIYFLAIAGYPRQWISEYPDLERVATILMSSIRLNTLSNFPLSIMPENMGGINFKHLFQCVATYGSNIEHLHLQQFDLPENLKLDLFDSISNLYCWMLGRALSLDICESNFANYLMVRVDQMNKDLSLLYRDRMQESIGKTIDIFHKNGSTTGFYTYAENAIDSAITDGYGLDDFFAIRKAVTTKNRMLTLLDCLHLIDGNLCIIILSKSYFLDKIPVKCKIDNNILSIKKIGNSDDYFIAVYKNMNELISKSITFNLSDNSSLSIKLDQGVRHE